ncbi:MAG TPA: hypothetical protein VF836_11480 [Gemmatimonadaceae bacterium]
MSTRHATASSTSSRSLASRRPPSPASALPRLDSRTFLRGVVDRVQTRVPADFPPIHSISYSYMAQLWSGNKQLHYEAWIRDRLGVIEIGLHFEADALTNARLLAAFRARERAIHRALGADVRVEAWDKGWARVWEPIALATLDGSFLELIGGRIAAYVMALEPLLRAEVPSDVAWSEPRPRR